MRLDRQPLADFLAAIGSTASAPGCGAAAGVALGLAAACAAKAVRISALHAPNERMDRAAALCDRIGDAALDTGADDAAHFAGLIEALRRPHDAARETATAAAQDGLAGDGHRLLAGCHALRRLIALVEDDIAANMAGDLAAARLLADACEGIARGNLGEAATPPVGS